MQANAAVQSSTPETRPVNGTINYKHRRRTDQKKRHTIATDDAAVIMSGGIDSSLVSAIIEELDDNKYGKKQKPKKGFYHSITPPVKNGD